MGYGGADGRKPNFIRPSSTYLYLSGIRYA